MFTGRLPFETNDSDELAAYDCQLILYPHLLNPLIPSALEQIILKVLSKEPSQRYRTADQLGRVLLSFGQLPDNIILFLPQSCRF